jgi:hypothetical protein
MRRRGLLAAAGFDPVGFDPGGFDLDASAGFVRRETER